MTYRVVATGSTSIQRVEVYDSSVVDGISTHRVICSRVFLWEAG